MRRAGAVALLALLVVGCEGSGGGGRATRSTATAPSTATSAGGPDACAAPPVAVGGPSGTSPYVTGLASPTALAWAPDGRLFIAERRGTIKIFDGRSLTTFATVPTVTSERGGGYSERGLLGLALSPSFATDHRVYAFYSATDFTTQVVVRWEECRGRAGDPVTLVTLPAGPDCCHKGGRLAFGPDGNLYVALGDEHSVPVPPAGPMPPVPQDPADLRGKILRYDPDGKVPADNPFGPTNPVWALGFRNPFGLAFDEAGRAFVTVNGPTGDAGSPSSGYDLAFVVTAGGRYQWPYCYGYSHVIAPYPSCNGLPEPDWSSERSTVVPTGATYVDRRGPAPYAGHFVFCTYDGGMRIFTEGSPHAAVTEGPPACRLDVKQGPDHALYFSDDATVYRLA